MPTAERVRDVIDAVIDNTMRGWGESVFDRAGTVSVHVRITNEDDRFSVSSDMEMPVEGPETDDFMAEAGAAGIFQEPPPPPPTRTRDESLRQLCSMGGRLMRHLSQALAEREDLMAMPQMQLALEELSRVREIYDREAGQPQGPQGPSLAQALQSIVARVSPERAARAMAALRTQDDSTFPKEPPPPNVWDRLTEDKE